MRRLQESPIPATSASDDLRHKSLQLAALHEIGKALTSSLDLKEILNSIMNHISEVLKPRNWSLLLLDQETGELRFEIVVGECADKLKDLRIKPGEGVAGWAAREKKPILVPDVSKDKRFSKKADDISSFVTKSIICVPLVTHGKCLGVIELINKAEDSSFAEDDLMLLTTMADYTAIAIENAIFFKQVQELTITDDLTKLYNSRFLHSRLDYEIERSKRFKCDLSLIFLDLDDFKEINDRYGHVHGSKLLREVAGLIVGLIRTVDMACRYGGDEFIILIPETSKANTVVVAEKLRTAIKNTLFLKDEGMNLKITGSFGVASFPHDASNKDELIHMADILMYKVKHRAKDGVYAG